VVGAREDCSRTRREVPDVRLLAPPECGVLGRRLGLPAEGRHVVPLRLVDLRAVVPGVAFIGRERQVDHGGSFSGIAKVGIVAEAPDEFYSV